MTDNVDLKELARTLLDVEMAYSKNSLEDHVLRAAVVLLMEMHKREDTQ
jgi:hypothetical protein